jgi:hypothetical protein
LHIYPLLYGNISLAQEAGQQNRRTVLCLDGKSSQDRGRTDISLGIEWILHNLAHRALGYEAARSTDFDFKEEGWGIFDYIRKWKNREKAKYNDK